MHVLKKLQEHLGISSSTQNQHQNLYGYGNPIYQMVGRPLSNFLSSYQCPKLDLQIRIWHYKICNPTITVRNYHMPVEPIEKLCYIYVANHIMQHKEMIPHVWQCLIVPSFHIVCSISIILSICMAHVQYVPVFEPVLVGIFRHIARYQHHSRSIYVRSSI